MVLKCLIKFFLDDSLSFPSGLLFTLLPFFPFLTHPFFYAFYTTQTPFKSEVPDGNFN